LINNRQRTLRLPNNDMLIHTRYHLLVIFCLLANSVSLILSTNTQQVI